MSDENNKTTRNYHFNAPVHNSVFGDNGTINVAHPNAEPVWVPASVTGEKRVFISYRRSDWDTFVAPTIQKLYNAGIPYWLDQADIRGGDNWRDRINDALMSCKILLLFVTPNALQSDYVKYEYRYFAQKPDRILLPLMCVDTPLPPELTGIQHVRFHQHDILLEQLNSLTS